MYNIVLAVHILVSILLVCVILIQRGRGGGLVEALSGAESLFGTKTSSFLVKTTTTLAILFFILSTTLAFLSKQKGRSLLDKISIEEPVEQEATPSEVKPSSESVSEEMPAESKPQDQDKGSSPDEQQNKVTAEPNP